MILKDFAYQFTRGIEISFPLHCKIYRENVCLHLSFIVGITIFHTVYLVQLQLISQVHYINDVTFHNKKSHAIHTNLIRIEHCL